MAHSPIPADNAAIWRTPPSFPPSIMALMALFSATLPAFRRQGRREFRQFRRIASIKGLSFQYTYLFHQLPLT
ncbi:MAG: hypothetical protein J0M33_13205 [Anaerolineae bacterium]|nr:hypothetical protein [Anaerolineae bacterium]